jgi:hypothetical protein
MTTMRDIGNKTTSTHNFEYGFSKPGAIADDLPPRDHRCASCLFPNYTTIKELLRAVEQKQTAAMGTNQSAATMQKEDILKDAHQVIQDVGEKFELYRGIE